MKRSTERWLLALLLLVSATYAIAEDITLTTYYPSPRGVYREIRIGSGTVSSPSAKLHVTLPSAETGLVLRVDDQNNDATPFVIDENGRVSVGAVTPPSGSGAKLYVVGPVEADGFRAFEQSGVYGFVEAGPNDGWAQMGGWSLVTRTAAPTFLDGAPLALQNRGGTNVGIGTTTPRNRLDVEGAAVIGAGYSGTSTAPVNGLLIEGNTGMGTATPRNRLDVEGAAVIGAGYSGANTAPANGLLIEGNVGIGTTSPSATLEVAGSVRIADGTQGAGKVLTSDGGGRASWQSSVPNCRLCLCVGTQAACESGWSCVPFNGGVLSLHYEDGSNGRGTGVQAEVRCP